MESNNIKLNNNQENFVFTFDTLKKYYSKYYPSELILNWLSKNNLKNLKYREFCFTLKNNQYIRFQSFKSIKEYNKRINALNPVKIDIGGIYNKEPRNYIENKNDQDFICKEKELIFDIDLKDYDEVRKCCQQNDICSKCWKYIISGAKILERILNEDFGFNEIFFVFSGRRGIHCWVCDKRACVLEKNGRNAIERYIYYEKVKDNIRNNNEIKNKRNFYAPIHPSYISAISLIENDFYDIIKEQDLLNDIKIKNIFKIIISLYFDLIDMNIIDEILGKNWNSLKKIKKILDILKDAENILKNKNNINYCVADACIKEFMMHILYPRLDRNVTIQINHLLKGPFCVHPKTGYISVPMSIELMEKLSFNKIPKVDYLIEDENKEERERFYEYINFFEKFVKNINENEDDKINKYIDK